MPKCPFLQSVIMDSTVGLMNHLLEMPTYCILSWYVPYLASQSALEHEKNEQLILYHSLLWCT